jgi:hypothetical protein
MIKKSIKKSSKKNIRKTIKKNIKLKNRYFTHANGGRPFEVEDYGNKVIVYKQTYEEEDDIPFHWIREKKLFEIPYKKIFVGDNDLNYEKYLKKGKGSKGNSILLEHKKEKNKYTYIGSDIGEFKTINGDVIKKYYSPIGNNDVPYPFAIGEKYTYLIIEEVYIPNEKLDFTLDIYGQYYGFLTTSSILEAKTNLKNVAKDLTFTFF